MRGVWTFGCVAALMVAAMGCGSEGQAELIVRLQTDLVPEEEFTTIELVLTGRNDADSRELRVDADATDYLESPRVAELFDLKPGSYRLGVSLLDRDGNSLVERPVLLSLAGTASVTVPITRSCLNVDCGDELACFGGECVDPACTIENLDACGQAVACSEAENTNVGNVACDFEAECVRSECIAGVCWAATKSSDDAASCDASISWCHPEVGCLPRDQSVDDPSECPNGAVGNLCLEALSSVVSEACTDGVRGAAEDGIDCGGPCTPCSATFDCEAQGVLNVHECRALVAIYDATDGPNWGSGPSTGWVSDPNPCQWRGVLCSGKNVFSLSLQGAGGDESVLPPELGNLIELTSLNIEDFEGLSGAIPPEIGKLSKLRSLDAENANITLALPNRFWTLASLESLVFNETPIPGRVPEEIRFLSALVDLEWARDPVLIGPLPEGIAELGALKALDMPINPNLGGSVPVFLGQMTQLEELDLGSDGLHGTIPSEIGNMSALRILELDSNALTGTLPLELANLRNLEVLLLNENTFTGTIPSGMRVADGDAVISLFQNQLSGPVPADLLQGSGVRSLDLTNNSLEGPLPEIPAVTTHLETLELRRNSISGAIPASWSKLRGLRVLNFQENQLSGNIPASLGDLSALTELDLDINMLTGAVPASLANTRLSDLDLRNNQLSGPVPPELELLPLTDLDLQENQCLWTTECPGFESFLDTLSPGWDLPKIPAACSPPPEACN